MPSFIMIRIDSAGMKTDSVRARESQQYVTGSSKVARIIRKALIMSQQACTSLLADTIWRS
jgi:hypothetical protein